jgi:hypothetical protein
MDEAERRDRDSLAGVVNIGVAACAAKHMGRIRRHDLICGFDYSTTQLAKATSLHQSAIFDSLAAACSSVESRAGTKLNPKAD